MGTFLYSMSMLEPHQEVATVAVGLDSCGNGVLALPCTMTEVATNYLLLLLFYVLIQNHSVTCKL